MKQPRILCDLMIAICLAITPAYGDQTDEVFGAKVRRYLLDNPELILEVMDLLSERQVETATAALLEPHLEALFETEMDLRVGRNDAPKVMIEFFDYNCPACRANMPVIREFVAANPDVAIVKKHLPILSPGSERAARFVLAARIVYGEVAYHRLHSALYAKQGVLSLSRLEGLAQELSLDATLIEDQMQNAEVSRIIESHRDIAVSLQVIGTPTFATPRAMVVGKVTLEILAELAKGA